MSYHARASTRRLSTQLEALEARNLLSLLINAQPTLDVQPSPGVYHFRTGFAVTQPAIIRVFGTAQPPIGLTATVEIFAENSTGQFVNGGLPLATATPDLLGRYSAAFTLPSRVRKDTNFLVAFETVSGSIVSNLAINPTTLSGLDSSLAIEGTTLPNSNAQLAIDVSAQTGTAAIAGTTGTSTTPVTEFAVSDPVTIRIHVPPGLAADAALGHARVARNLAQAHPTHDHPLRAIPRP